MSHSGLGGGLDLAAVGGNGAVKTSAGAESLAEGWRPKPIGGIRLENPFLLAPLAGVTDTTFRRLCKEQGAAMVCTEMVSASGLFFNDRKTADFLEFYDEERPIAFQLFGKDPERMAFAAEKLDHMGNSLLDVNMGCPVPKVVKNGEGSALLKDPDLAARIVAAMTRVSSKPVTVKIRAGWDENSVNAVEMAVILEQAGAAAVALHGRTREQFYSGHADWDIIRRVKAAVKIPVIGNGDVRSGADAARMLEETGCDYVMIARGALGNPWIFADAAAAWRTGGARAVGLEERLGMMRRHLGMLVAEKGEYRAVREMRKHVAWYLKGVRGSADFKKKANAAKSSEELFGMMDGLSEGNF